MKKSLASSSKKDREVEEEREETTKRRILEYPNISKDTLKFVLSLQVERKILKVSELETIYATAEQQEEMERLLKKNNKD